MKTWKEFWCSQRGAMMSVYCCVSACSHRLMCPDASSATETRWEATLHVTTRRRRFFIGNMEYKEQLWTVSQVTGVLSTVSWFMGVFCFVSWAMRKILFGVLWVLATVPGVVVCSPNRKKSKNCTLTVTTKQFEPKHLKHKTCPQLLRLCFALHRYNHCFDSTLGVGGW